MRSRAHFRSHPLHPMLIALPATFIPAAFLADLLGRLFEVPNLWPAGAYLSIAAVLTGLAAGVPGFIDYLYVVPPKSSAGRRATIHMLVNVSALVLMVIGMWFRDWDLFRPTWTTVLFELLSLVLVSIGGWLGGTLVYRNQIAVDHRYAHSGKWQEQEIEGSAGEMAPIDGAEHMKPGQMRLLHWGGRRLVLARTNEGFSITEDRCTHKGGPLSDGALVGRCVQCPWHGSQFDVTNGSVIAGPATEAIAVYSADFTDGRLRVKLPG